MARRAIWTGSVSFGLVNVPISLYSAIDPKEVHFNLVHETDGGRIHQKRVCDKDGEEVPWEEVAKGYAVTKRKMVMVTTDELQALDPKASRTIDIVDFVDGAEINPLFYDHSYYAGPKDEAAKKPYALLHQAMVRLGKVAIARMVMRTKQYLCTVRPVGKTLVVTTMQYADEIRDPDEIPHLGGAVKAGGRELELAERLVESLTGPFKPDQYKDDYRERVIEMIEQKAKGKTIEPAEAAPDEPEVVDLAAALEASLGRKAGGGAGGRRRTRATRAASKKSGTTRRKKKSA
jgi:DNA end-binding protein Ku